MKSGSVIIDLAAASGGNCELTQNGVTIDFAGITIIGDSELAYSLSREASKLFSVTITNFIKHLTKNGLDQINFEDEIVQGTLLKNE